MSFQIAGGNRTTQRKPPSDRKNSTHTAEGRIEPPNNLLLNQFTNAIHAGTTSTKHVLMEPSQRYILVHLFLGVYSVFIHNILHKYLTSTSYIQFNSTVELNKQFYFYSTFYNGHCLKTALQKYKKFKKKFNSSLMCKAEAMEAKKTSLRSYDIIHICSVSVLYSIKYNHGNFFNKVGGENQKLVQETMISMKVCLGFPKFVFLSTLNFYA